MFLQRKTAYPIISRLREKAIALFIASGPNRE
jgi:hypothetical protein